MKDYKFRYVFTVLASCLCTALTVYAVTAIDPGTVQNPTFNPGERNVDFNALIKRLVAEEVARVAPTGGSGGGGTGSTGSTTVSVNNLDNTAASLRVKNIALGGYNIDTTKEVTAPRLWADDISGVRYNGAEMTLTTKLCLAGTCKTSWDSGLQAGSNNSHLLFAQKSCTISAGGSGLPARTTSCICDAGYVALGCPVINYSYGFDPPQAGSFSGSISTNGAGCNYSLPFGFTSSGISVACLKVAD